jgi:segregation and condensation protein A
MEMKDRLIVGSRVTMSGMITAVQDRRRQVLITFLSLLELGKMGFVSLYQTDTYQEIYIETLRPIEQEVMNRVEEYDSLNSNQIAAEIMLENKTVDLADDSFLLPDEKDDDQLVLEAQPLDESEIASDEEILNAERELQMNERELTIETFGETSGEPEAMA